MTRAVFRAEATPSLGIGHVMRCRVLADGLAAMGWQTTFAVTKSTVDTVPSLAPHVVVQLASDTDPQELRDWVGARDLLVIDHYGLAEEYETACRDWVGRILVVDDLANRRHDCDLLLDQSPGRDGERLRWLGSRRMHHADRSGLCGCATAVRCSGAAQPCPSPNERCGAQGASQYGRDGPRKRHTDGSARDRTSRAGRRPGRRVGLRRTELAGRSDSGGKCPPAAGTAQRTCVIWPRSWPRRTWRSAPAALRRSSAAAWACQR